MQNLIHAHLHTATCGDGAVQTPTHKHAHLHTAPQPGRTLFSVHLCKYINFEVCVCVCALNLSRVLTSVIPSCSLLHCITCQIFGSWLNTVPLKCFSVYNTVWRKHDVSLMDCFFFFSYCSFLTNIHSQHYSFSLPSPFLTH